MQVLVLTTQVRYKEFWRRWLMKIKLIFTRKVLDVASVWKWWLLELGHELFIIKISSLEIRLSQSWCPFFQYFNSFRFCHRHDRCIVIFILNQLHNPTGNFFWAVKKEKKLSVNWKFMKFCGFRRTPELRAPRQCHERRWALISSPTWSFRF